MECCPRCKSKNFRKEYIVKLRQRYLCKDCHYRFTVKYVGKPDKMKNDALIRYLEGLGFRTIVRSLKVSYLAVFNWIKGFGEKLENFRNSVDIEVVEIDEMHAISVQKKLRMDLDGC